MTRPLLAVLLLAAAPALAQSGDLSVTLGADSRVATPSFTYFAKVRWSGADAARDVVLEVTVPGTVTDVNAHVPRMKCTNVSPVRCTAPLLVAGDAFAGVSVTVTLPAAGTYVASATASTATPESPAENNRATHTLVVAGLPHLRGFLHFADANVDPGAEGVVAVWIANSGATATNVVLRARLENGGTFLRSEPVKSPGVVPLPQPRCTIEQGEAICRVDVLPAGQSEPVRLVYRAPDRLEGGDLVVSGSVESDREDFDPSDNTFSAGIVLRRMLVVSSAGDAGAGTLRQALLDARTFCEFSPCTIAFAGVTHIQPRTPLPELGGVLRIDGKGTRVELDGSLLPAGDALHFSGGCELEVRDLAIRNFPGHGIEAWQTAEERDACTRRRQFTRGLTVTNTHFSGNTRGVVTKNIDSALIGNVIHEQRRAGIFIDGAYYSVVQQNVIVNNGASGVFVNTSDQSRHGGIPPGAEITQNVIHGNAEWGVARTKRGIVQVRENSIARNALYGIDVGLDLGARDGVAGLPEKPVLLSATYDPVAHQTVVRVSAPSGGKVDLYASSSLSAFGYPEAETWLKWEWARPAAFDIRVDGDLRGQWITATTSFHSTLFFLREEGTPATNVSRPATGVNTSELSDAIRVQ